GAIPADAAGHPRVGAAICIPAEDDGITSAGSIPTGQDTSVTFVPSERCHEAAGIFRSSTSREDFSIEGRGGSFAGGTGATGALVARARAEKHHAARARRETNSEGRAASARCAVAGQSHHAGAVEEGNGVTAGIRGSQTGARAGCATSSGPRPGRTVGRHESQEIASADGCAVRTVGAAHASVGGRQGTARGQGSRYRSAGPRRAPGEKWWRRDVA